MNEKAAYKVELRALEPEDIDLLYNWENNREIWQVSNTLTPFSKYVLTRYIESAHLDIFQTRQLRLMIDIVNNNGSHKTIGAVDLFDYEPFHQRAGVGILIGDSSERHKGYADSALKELISYTFGTLQLHQIYCNINPQNKASVQLFEKNGFTRSGVKKGWNKNENGFADEAIFQLINTNCFIC